MIKAVIIGLGGVAQLHRYAYWYLNRNGFPVELVAAYNRDPSKFDTVTKINLPLGEIHDEKPFGRYTDINEMLEKEKPDLVDICQPTFLHRATATDMLRRGYNVLCEKPMALSYADCLDMLEASRASGASLMIGHCLRFSPVYIYLRDVIRNNTYGRIVSSKFCRFSPPPFWSKDNWQGDVKRSGGCIHDLSIHDLDFVRWAMGEPEEVSCTISNRVVEADSSVSKLYYDGHCAEVIADWSDADCVFNALYDVEFENARIVMHNNKVTLYQNGVSAEVKLEEYESVIGEIQYYTGLLENGGENTECPPESSAKTILLIEKLKESSEKGIRVKFDE